VPKNARLLRILDRRAITDRGNSAGVPYPDRGRRAWLEKLAAARYAPGAVAWKALRR